MKKLIYILPLFCVTTLFAQEAEPLPPQQSMWHTLIMISIAIGFFYLLLWRPEQKRRKALEQQRSSLKQGDKVVAMGIIGTVLRVQDETVILKMYDGAKMEVLKGAITDVTGGSDDEPRKSDKVEQLIEK